MTLRQISARPDSEPKAERAAGQRDTETAFFEIRSSDFKAVGELEDIAGATEELEAYDPEDDWRELEE